MNSACRAIGYPCGGNRWHENLTAIRRFLNLLWSTTVQKLLDRLGLCKGQLGRLNKFKPCDAGMGELSLD